MVLAARPQNAAACGAAPIAVLRPTIPEDRVQAIVRDGVAHHQAGRLDDALAHYDAALRLDPWHFDALNNRGIALRGLGRVAEAITTLRRAAEAAPERPEPWHNLGNALIQAGELAAAQEALVAATVIDPAAAGSWRSLAAVCGRRSDHVGEAAACREVVALCPDDAEAWNNLGAALFASGHTAAARAATARAIAQRPGFAMALKNHGVVLAHQGEYLAAAAVLGQAVASGGTDAATLAALGQALVQAGDARGAARCFERALAADPNNLDAMLGRARAAFLLGDMADAWQAYEARWRIAGNTPPDNLNAPEWRGEDIAGRTILIWAEQGIGDTLNFIRYAPLLAARGARVLAMVQAPVAALVATLPGIEAVVVPGCARPHFDVHAPLLGLPRHLGGALHQIPHAEGYLAVPPGTPAGLVPPRAGQRRVGLVWAGNPTHKNDRNRSLPLERLLPLCTLPGVAFFSLQVGEARGQLAATGADGLVHDLAPALGSYAATAQALVELDLVVTVDTSVAHLAGALGRPAWCLLPFAPDWRWQLGRADTPWYRSLRLFRQPVPGDWATPVAAIARELADGC